MTDAAAWVRVGGLDQLGDGARAVPLDVGGHALRDSPQLTADDEAAIVVAGQERLHNHTAVAALATGGGVAGAHRSVIREIEHDAPAVVAVDRLHGHGVTNRRGRGRGLVLGADHFRARDRDAGRMQQPVGELLVGGDVHPQRARLAGHGRPDPLLVDAVPQLDEGLLVEPDVRDVAQCGLVEEGLR